VEIEEGDLDDEEVEEIDGLEEDGEMAETEETSAAE